MQRYDPKTIESKWQKKWEADGTYKVDLSDSSKKPYFAFSMLPGITGAGIHIGHGRTYQFSDVKVRAKRQQGFNAYHPIGWDSFGLPVENYAIKIGKKPRQAHDEALVNFKNQLKRLGFSYDWSKEISTADPSYYKWTQWIFNKLLEHGLAYQKESPQWWCETDQTVLANEQVEAGCCWRCGNEVVKKNLKQWFFKITQYADEILNATDDLNWTEMVKTMQKNWIGKSQGAEVLFMVVDEAESRVKSQEVRVFTTRVDTLFGATFLVLAPEHELATKLAVANRQSSVASYIKQAQAKSEIERMETTRQKTGVFTGSYAINPASGDKIPIWVADYVLAGYGSGAIMAVPAHDERDNEFAKKFDLPVRQVVEPMFGESSAEELKKDAIIAIVRNPKDNTFLILDWGSRHKNHGGNLFVGGGIETGENPIEAARREIIEETGYNNLQHVATSEVFVNNHFYSPVKYNHYKARFLPVLFDIVDESQQKRNLDTNEDQFTFSWVSEDKMKQSISDPAHLYGYELVMNQLQHIGEGELVNSAQFNGMRSEEAREEITAWLQQQGQGSLKTNYKMRDWLISRQRYWGAPIPIIHCAKCGAVPVPDKDLPVILPEVENFKPTGGETSVLASQTDWVNVKCPKCDDPAKRETDTLDGYACSSWYFLRYLDPHNQTQAWDPEIINNWLPVNFYNGADHAVAHLLYARFWMRFFYKIGLVNTPEPFGRMMYNAYIMAPGGKKMSKSLGNVIDPLEIMDSGYGADALRVYEMFIAPFDQEAPWDPRGVPGSYRFLNRVWNLVQEYTESSDVELSDQSSFKLLQTSHKTIKKVTADIENDKFNTAISTMMETVNSYFKFKQEFGIGANQDWRFALESLLQVLAPFAPHISEQLWQQLGHSDTIHVDHWPDWDDSLLASDTIKIPVQVNGKVRTTLEVTKDISEKEIIELAKAQQKIIPFITNKQIKKSIYVTGRIVNLVVVN